MAADFKMLQQLFPTLSPTVKLDKSFFWESSQTEHDFIVAAIAVLSAEQYVQITKLIIQVYTNNCLLTSLEEKILHQTSFLHSSSWKQHQH